MSLKKPVVWTLHDMWAFTGFASDSVTLKNPNKKKVSALSLGQYPNLSFV